ncbi:MAG: hypothetical protein NPIRA06_04730 [Nitrospirales bacterium]|nr:MAG: hypothetical protein NPIRA06_04730 [Nitrospirales bacterium]
MEKNLKTSNRLLSLAECEVKTGRKVPTWRKAIARRQVPFVRIGRNVRIPEEYIEKLIAEGWYEPVQEA